MKTVLLNDNQSAGCGPQGRARLPCLKGNNSDEQAEPSEAAVSDYSRKRVYAIERNVDVFVRQHGIDRCGFFTITFPRNVVTWRDSQRRFNNFARRILRSLFLGYISVLEFHRDGRPHYHLVVATTRDIRTGFDFDVYKLLHQDSRKPVPNRMTLGLRRQLSRRLTSNVELKLIWRTIRHSADRYGVGRCELVPIRTNGEALGRYVCGYIKKSLGYRKPEHKGARFVRYSQSFKHRAVKSSFSWSAERGWVWRKKIMIWAIRNGCFSLAQIREKFGGSWRHRYREAIRATKLNWFPTGRHARVEGHWVPADVCNVRITRFST
jgi:hypothetical protein